MTGAGGELQLVIDTARSILSAGAAGPGGDITAGIWRQLEDAGFLLIAVPEPAGGGWLEAAAAVARLCGELMAPVPYADAALVAAPLLAGAGLALPAGLVTAADAAAAHVERDCGRLRLRLELPHVPWGSAAGAVVVAVNDGDRDLVASLDPSWATAVAGRNLAGEPRDLLRFDAGVPPGRWAAAPAGTAFELRLRGALARSLAMSGAASAALAMALRYARERVQFGRPIAKFQAVQHAIAELAVEVEAMRVSADAAVRACARDGFGSASARIAVAAAKVQAGAGGAVAARVAHQVHGAIGTTREHPLHLATTRLWAWRDDFGSERAWQGDLAVTTLAGDPWEAITG